MPLPAALAKKLQKRGIITPKVEVTKNASFKGYEGCPNKYNIYHGCTKFCMIRWKVGILEPTAKYVKQRERLLRKYPLPNNWREIYDRGCGRFYYWDTKNDVVSWLPPKHPKAKISHSAAYLREEKSLQDIEQKKLQQDEVEKSIVPLEPKENLPADVKKKSRYKDIKKIDRESEPLDPMDPAAYSDIPKGTWASGLEQAQQTKETRPIKIPATPVYQIKNFHPPTNKK